MRINEACFFLLAVLVGAIWLPHSAMAMSPETLNANASQASCGKKALGKAKAASKIQEVDSSDRKLALSIPGLGTANISLTPAINNSCASGAKSSVKSPSSSYAISRSGNNITVKVPETVDEAFDYAHVVSKQVGKLANEGGTQLTNFAKWIGIYIKQLGRSVTVTPVGYPYMNTSSVQAPTHIVASHKLYLTTEGRLKTVVQR